MRPVLSPWVETFERFARSIRYRAIVVAPFITKPPLREFSSLLDTKSPPQISLLTNLTVDSLLQGSIDSRAIAEFCNTVPTTVVRHLPGLHAKVYVADNHTAIITSGNLTLGSLHHNYEYGIIVNDSALVERIVRDLQEYSKLGAQVSIDELNEIAEASESLRDKHKRALNSARSRIRQEFKVQLEAVHDSLRQLRGKPGETTNSIFSRTILYLLNNRTLATTEMHPLIQSIHPDLCDDGVERVINNIHFGKEWKHRVRGAQVDLRRKGSIDLVEGKWILVQKEANATRRTG